MFPQVPLIAGELLFRFPASIKDMLCDNLCGKD